VLEILICEDDRAYRERMEQYISDYVWMEGLDLKIVVSSHDPEAVLKWVRESVKTRIYFLDVELEAKMDGFSLGAKIRKHDPNGYIFYFSAYGERASLNYTHQVGAINYIVKPNNWETLQEEIKKCLQVALERFTLSTANRKVLRIKQDEEVLYIPHQEVLFFEADENRNIILQTVTKRLRFKGALKEVEKLDEYFCRCHRSFVVNAEQVAGVDLRGKFIRLYSGDEIEGSRKGVHLLDDMLKTIRPSLN